MLDFYYMKCCKKIRDLRSIIILFALSVLLAASVSAWAVEAVDPFANTSDPLAATPDPFAAAPDPLAVPQPQDVLPNPTGPSEDTSNSLPLPGPSLGDSAPPDNSKQVNRLDDEDHIYLPNPTASQDYFNPPVNNADGGVAMPQSYSTSGSSGSMDRPRLGISIGPALRSYATSLAPQASYGGVAAATFRFLSLAQVLLFQAYFDVEYYHTSHIGNWTNVQDLNYHMGFTGELALGRKFQLYLSLLRRSNKVSADRSPGTSPDIKELAYVNEDPIMQFGAGAQYDFYIIPHGSIGLRLFVEPNIGYLALTFQMEPAPRKKFNLNYDDSNPYF